MSQFNDKHLGGSVFQSHRLAILRYAMVFLNPFGLFLRKYLMTGYDFFVHPSPYIVVEQL